MVVTPSGAPVVHNVALHQPAPGHIVQKVTAHSNLAREPMFGMPPPTWGASQGVRGEVERQEVRLSISHPSSRGSINYCHTWTKSSSSWNQPIES